MDTVKWYNSFQLNDFWDMLDKKKKAQNVWINR
jgi:hypothetical protein